MNEHFWFETAPRPNVEKVNVKLTRGQHEDIQNMLEDITVELGLYAEPSIVNDRVRFIPIPSSFDGKRESIKGVGTVVDLTVSSSKEYFEDTSKNTYGILAEFISGNSLNSPLEEISKTDIIGDLKASDINLLSRNQLQHLTTDITFDQLTQSLYDLTGIESIYELGDPDKNYTFKGALKLLFKDLVSRDNSSKLLISEISREKTYLNEDHGLFVLTGSPVEYESATKVRLESIDHLRPNDRHNPLFHSLGLICIGMVNLFENGRIYQEFDYRYFRGMKNKPTVTMSLKSEDFTHTELKSKLKGLDKKTDGATITSGAIELLSQIVSVNSL